jgi:hypothetical protein
MGNTRGRRLKVVERETFRRDRQDGHRMSGRKSEMGEMRRRRPCPKNSIPVLQHREALDLSQRIHRMGELTS